LLLTEDRKVQRQEKVTWSKKLCIKRPALRVVSFFCELRAFFGQINADELRLSGYLAVKSVFFQFFHRHFVTLFAKIQLNEDVF
jgi:hypothetical protein